MPVETEVSLTTCLAAYASRLISVTNYFPVTMLGSVSKPG